MRTQVKEKNAMDITEKIKKLKEEKNAVILAHYYVRPEVQEIADYIGDSFYLSKVAVGLTEQTIIFAGVSFMGESAKILNPGKTVLMPDASADCAMAHMADAQIILKSRSYRQRRRTSRERISRNYEDVRTGQSKQNRMDASFS